jgi:[ribosomal protein S18]-alanine N-acetyltransferase
MENPAPHNKNASLRIRNVDAANIADLIRIGEETNLSHWSAESYLDELKNPLAIMLRLVNDLNETVGFVVGRIIMGGAIETGLEAEIYNIAIAKDHHGLGRGQMLFDAFRSESLIKNATNIWLEVRESNNKAIGFYEKNGFARIQTRNHFYENPREHAVLMKLEMKP